jgi:hypothetical protein
VLDKFQGVMFILVVAVVVLLGKTSNKDQAV